MKSSTRLDSIAFQLTPTRTRCDLVIIANGKTEKIASGLLNPFLAHLKVAQEQIGKGGYSIVLEPNHGSDAIWFTKATVQRFVRFVSTPEILERVYTIECEILQIDKAISLQNSNDAGSHVVDLPVKSEQSPEGSKRSLGGDEEKAIVLYQPASHQSQEDESTALEKNSKVQLVQVLETRKSVLQKEQGMAFARAVAASFDIDNIAALLAFAECFGASRMIEACKKFVTLWKAKHESGQWVEVDAAEAISCRADMPSTNAAGIVFLSPNEPQGEVASEKNGVSDHQAQLHPQEYCPGQFPHSVFRPWQMHPQANGMPVYQQYPMQGMPYYQNYPGNAPFFQPPYSPCEDPRSHAGQGTRRRRHSMDSRDMSAESETQETDTLGRRMQDDMDSDEEDSVSRRRMNRSGKSSRKQSGTVVIRNINYIASAKQGPGDCESQSCSDSGTDDDGGSGKGDKTRKSEKKGLCNSLDADEHWKAFQNFLLTDADESNNSSGSGMFAMEGKVQGRKRQTTVGDVSSTLGRHTLGRKEDGDFTERLDFSGDTTCARRPVDDPMLSYGQEANIGGGQTGVQFAEAEIRKGTYRRSADGNLDYMINRQEKLTDLRDSSLDPVITNGIQDSSKNNARSSSQGITDESFVVLQRSGFSGQVAGGGRTAMDMEYQLTSGHHKTENRTAGATTQSNYEPNDLNLIPSREVEDGQSGYDPAMDYEMQAQMKDASKHNGNRKKVAADAKDGPRKVVKDQKSKAERRITAGTKRERPKLSPLEDARARAEKLRAFKADLQKLKKEKENEQLKRLEALKMERQKRIAARSGTNVPQSPLPSQQARKQLPKLSPISQKGSKFSDTEPGSSSPLQRSTLKTISKRSVDPKKALKSENLKSSENRLTRSASSLSMRKDGANGLTSDSKAALLKIRRLSEPNSSIHPVSSGKARSTEVVSRHRVAERPEAKKMSDPVNSLTEQKLRASKGSSVTIQKKSTNKETLHRPTAKMHSRSLDTSNPSSGISPSAKDGDDNTIVEKNVVMLECEKPSVPVFHGSEYAVPKVQSDACNNPGDKSLSEEDATVPAPTSPIIVREVVCKPSKQEVEEQSYTAMKEPKKVSSTLATAATAGQLYEAPYARVSSLEDPCMAESEYGKAPPTCFDTEPAVAQTTAALVSDIQRQDQVKTSQADSGKHHGKESGFKRLLRFGRKSSGGSESNIDLDKGSLDASVADDRSLTGSSSEALTLKNLLIQEETSSTGTTPKKSSRSFSLLSPFKTKSSERKLTT